MALKQFSLSEVCVQTEFQKMVDQIPKSLVLHWNPREGTYVFGVGSSYSATPDITLNLRPASGDYVNLLFRFKPSSARGIYIKTCVRIAGQEEVYDETYVAYASGDLTEHMLHIPVNALTTLGDVSGEDIELCLYFKRGSGSGTPDIVIDSLRVLATNAPTADSCWWWA